MAYAYGRSRAAGRKQEAGSTRRSRIRAHDDAFSQLCAFELGPAGSCARPYAQSPSLLVTDAALDRKLAEHDPHYFRERLGSVELAQHPPLSIQAPLDQIRR